MSHASEHTQGAPSLPAAVTQITAQRITRLELFRRGGRSALAFGGAATLLAACGASTTGGGASTPASATGEVGELDFFSWEGYDFPTKAVPAMQAWKAANGVRLKSSYIASHDDIQAKLKGGGGAGVDLSTYVQQYKDYYRQLGLLTTLDPDKLPNLKNLLPFFASNVGNFWVEPDGSRTGVPMYWGNLALTYDSTKIRQAPSTYDQLFDPSYKGKVAIADAPHDVFGLITVILGMDYSRLTSADLAKVTDYAKRVIDQSTGVSASYGDVATRLASGEAVFGFPGWPAMNKFAADAGRKTITTSTPKEGGFGFSDAYFIPKTADNVEGAYRWINEGLSPKVNAEAADSLAGGTPVSTAVPLLNTSTRALYPYENLEKYLDEMTFVLLPPVKSTHYVTLAEVYAAWNKLKAQG